MPFVSCNCKDFDKKQNALNSITLQSTYYLQSILKTVGFDHVQREVYRPTFLHFMYWTLLELAQKLHDIKSKLLLDTIKEENVLLKLNNIQRNLFGEVEPRMRSALELFDEKFPNHLRYCMINAGFDRSETKESCESFLSFFLSVLLSETDKWFRFKSSFWHPGSNDITSKELDKQNLSIQIERSSDSSIRSSSNPGIEDITLQFKPSHPSLKLVSSTRRHGFYRISSENIALKVLKAKLPHLTNLTENLNNEFTIANAITHPVIRRCYTRAKFENNQALSLEWAPGRNINDTKSLNTKTFLVIAREIMSGLLAMHREHIMHTDLSSEHIIINPDFNSVRIIGLGSSTSFSSKKNYVSIQELLEKDLRCISPEQTGRVNHEIDFRSDFYSLGIIYYKLLTGLYPFKSDDVLKLVNLHILQEPLAPCVINPKIPTSISNMTMKLMKKNAEDRYQTATGIIFDIDLMISEYVSDDRLQSVVLGQHDISRTILVPQKLYGRSMNYKTLLSVFERTKPNSFELVFITGEVGCGKSALTFELYKAAARRDGFLLCGKYDYSKSEPYSALLEAVKNLCDDILLKDKVTLANYKYQIQASVGQEGSVLTDVIDNLHLIIGQQPNVFENYGQEAKSRFNYVFIKFIRAICSVGSPIILVLEDLQWLDSDSFDLVSTLLKDKFITNLMLIGTYRQNEVNDTHPVALLLHDIRSMDINMTSIILENLDHNSVNDLISETLCISNLETYPLTAYIHSKTKGNPFFVRQMLNSLSEKEVIFFCTDTCKWKWDNSIHEDDDISDNVVELLSEKILSLDEYTQQALKVASCIGSPFSLPLIKLIVNCSKGIDGALSTGLIIQYKRSKTLYRFVHDQIQLAAFSSLGPNKKEVFLYIGKKLWNVLTIEGLKKEIFTVVNLLYHARDILNEQDRSKIAVLFMDAGKKAMASTAFKRASKYLDAGIELLSTECWTTHYKLSLEIYYDAAKAAYCTGNETRMNLLRDEISKNATSSLDLVQSYLLQIRFYNDKRIRHDSIRTAVYILNMIGENIDLNQNDSIIVLEIEKAKKIICGKSNQEVFSVLTEMEDSVSLSIMMIYGAILSSAYLIDSSLFNFISLRMVHITFEHGLSQYSSWGFSALGAVLVSRNDAYGYKFGNLALTLLQKAWSKQSLPLVYTIYYSLISPFYSSIHQSLEPLSKSFKVSIETGFVEGAFTSGIFYSHYSFLSGKSLPKLMDEIEIFKELQQVNTSTFLSINQAILNLTDIKTENPAILKGEFFDCRYCFEEKERMNSVVEEKERMNSVARILVICSFVAYLFHDYASAMKYVARGRPLKNYIISMYSYPIFIFYDGLISLELAKCGNEKEKRLKHVEENILKLKSMAEHAPENYLNKICLLEAEIAVVHSNESQALANYKKAISLSKKYCFLHEEAISCEKAGMYLLESSQDTTTAHMFLIQSYKCYESWGAISKMHHLVEKHPFLLEQIGPLPLSHDFTGELQQNYQSTVSNMTEADSTMHRRKRVRCTI